MVELRRSHPCGSRRWSVVRLGADIGLVCAGCGHRVLLERRALERRLVALIEPEENAPEAESPEAGP